jgi:hypothetical protein
MTFRPHPFALDIPKAFLFPLLPRGDFLLSREPNVSFFMSIFLPFRYAALSKRMDSSVVNTRSMFSQKDFYAEPSRAKPSRTPPYGWGFLHVSTGI